jgi:hypothetical protein
VFAVLFGCATVVLLPILGAGVLVSPIVLLLASSAQPDDWLMLLSTIGGVIGFIGLLRARRAAHSPTDDRVTIIFLAIGIATAIGLAVALVAVAGLLGHYEQLSAAGVVVLVIPVLAALGAISRLRRLRAAAEGQPAPDRLPLIFLAMALLELALAIAIGFELAIAG